MAKTHTHFSFQYSVNGPYVAVWGWTSGPNKVASEGIYKN